MDSIEKGIVELISEHDIRKLVIGAAADRSHSRYNYIRTILIYPLGVPKALVQLYMPMDIILLVQFFLP